MNRLSIIYAWAVRTVLFFFPDVQIIMRFRGFLYSIFMKKCGSNFQVAHNVIINNLSRLTCGDNVYIAPNSFLLCGGFIDISDNVLIAPGCLISSNNHTFENDSFRFGPRSFKSVSIGSGSWICANCVIVAGSNFPSRSILTPNSTYNLSDASSDSLYAGSPAKWLKVLR